MKTYQEHLDELAADIIAKVNADFYSRLDEEIKATLKRLGHDPEYISVELIRDLGLTMCYNPDGSAVILQDGSPISNVIHRAKFINPN